jgi:endonuclease G
VAQLARRFGSRLSVLNGPIFADHDRPYRQDFFVPSEYWKLILVKDDEGRPKALAFRLSQAEQIADLPRERFAPDEVAPFVPFQIAIDDLAALTGLDFGPVAALDALGAASDRRETSRRGPAARRIGSESDLVF